MSHSWESPRRVARETLLEILEPHLADRAVRKLVIDLAIEELDRQLGQPDDDMIVAGQEVLDASGASFTASLYYRRVLVEQIWHAMIEKAFGR
jgi:hypothetical protein